MPSLIGRRFIELRIDVAIARGSTSARGTQNNKRSDPSIHGDSTQSSG